MYSAGGRVFSSDHGLITAIVYNGNGLTIYGPQLVKAGHHFPQADATDSWVMFQFVTNCVILLPEDRGRYVSDR